MIHAHGSYVGADGSRRDRAASTTAAAVNATQGAKRALLSGDRMLLERRARDLARAAGVPLAALDRGLAWWDDPAVELEVPEEWPAALRSALAI